jgi:hypothetical protein
MRSSKGFLKRKKSSRNGKLPAMGDEVQDLGLFDK